jgi:SlyX protein
VTDQLLQRIEELEVRVAFQEDLLSTLNSGVAQLGDQMHNLRGELMQMRQALEAVRVALGHDMTIEPAPPHY